MDGSVLFVGVMFVIVALLAPVATVLGIATGAGVPVAVYVFTVIEIVIIVLLIADGIWRKLEDKSGVAATNRQYVFVACSVIGLAIAVYLLGGLMPKEKNEPLETHSTHTYSSYSSKTRSNSMGSGSGTTKSYSSGKNDLSSSQKDEYGASNYSDSEDFYDDNYDDFESFEDAEDYYDDNGGE